MYNGMREHDLIKVLLPTSDGMIAERQANDRFRAIRSCSEVGNFVRFVAISRSALMTKARCPALSHFLS